MKVLVACEYSGTVRDSLIKLGHDAISCDLLPSDTPGPHYMGDVRDILYEDWDLIIAHPDCTYVTNSGVCHLHASDSNSLPLKGRPRWDALDRACTFFNLFLDHPCHRICVENPIPHKYALSRLHGRKYTQIIQPWMFGHPEKKATCLWLKGLDKLEPNDDWREVKARMETLPKNQQQRLHYLPPSPDRWKLRSTTFTGIADAFAHQFTRE